MDSFNRSIENIIKSHTGIAHAKDAKTLKYVFTNDDNMQYLGIEDKNDIIGKDVFDLAKIMHSFWEESNVKKMYASDIQVIDSKKVSSIDDNVFLNSVGLIVVHSTKKIPILYDNKVHLVLTLISDLTYRETLWSIKSAYCRLYNNRESTIKFLQHFGFNSEVAKEITPRELDCMLSFMKCNSFKEVARDLNITCRTVEEHLKHIKEKLRCYTSDNLKRILIDQFYDKR